MTVSKCVRDANTKNRARQIWVLSAESLGGGVSYKNVRGFRWIYTGLKQLDIEWKPDVIPDEKGNRRQKTKHFFWSTSNKYFQKWHVNIAKYCRFTKPKNIRVTGSILFKSRRQGKYTFFYKQCFFFFQLSFSVV